MPETVTRATNCSFNPQVKYPAIYLAKKLGYDFSDWLERLMEVQLKKHGVSKLPWLDELTAQDKPKRKRERERERERVNRT